jgi:hypothetical protein
LSRGERRFIAAKFTLYRRNPAEHGDRSPKQLTMGNLKKKRRLKMNKHKRRKRLKANRHKKRTWQK